VKKKKYKNKHDFAGKVINAIPFVQSMNIKVNVNEYSVGYKPLDGDSFYGGCELMDKLSGVIDGLRYAYEYLEGE